MPSPLASLARPTAPGAIRLAQLARVFSEEEEQLSKETALHPRARSALFRESWPQSLRRQALANGVRSATAAERRVAANGGAALARGAPAVPGAARRQCRARRAGRIVRRRPRPVSRHANRCLCKRAVSVVPC